MRERTTESPGRQEDHSLRILHATLVTEAGAIRADIVVRDGLTATLSSAASAVVPDADEATAASGLRALPA
jgi:hypothetical protein